MPDFAQVYNFIGSVFDPEASGHLQMLKKMDPIDVETVCSQSYTYHLIIFLFVFVLVLHLDHTFSWGPLPLRQ